MATGVLTAFLSNKKTDITSSIEYTPNSGKGSTRKSELYRIGNLVCGDINFRMTTAINAGYFACINGVKIAATAVMIIERYSDDAIMGVGTFVYDATEDRTMCYSYAALTTNTDYRTWIMFVVE